MRKPNLFVVGAPKCATTTLHAYLSMHPECFMSPVKEPAYFSRSRVTSEVRRTVPYLQSEAAYMRLFAGATDKHRVIGESSTCYLRAEEDLAELKSFAGKPKIIAVVRDPVSLISSYFHYLRFQGWEPLTNLREAWAVQDERCAGHVISGTAHRPDSLAYRNVALLGEQVQRLFRMFDHDDVLILLSDDFREDTDSLCRKLQAFLGLTYTPDIEMPHSNAARAPRVRFIDGLMKRDSRILRHAKNSMKRLFNVQSFGIRRLIEDINSEPMRHSVDEELRDEIRAYYWNDVELLGRIMDRDLLRHWGWEKPSSVLDFAPQRRSDTRL
jgi:hypothetical protein